MFTTMNFSKIITWAMLLAGLAAILVPVWPWKLLLLFFVVMNGLGLWVARNARN